MRCKPVSHFALASLMCLVVTSTLQGASDGEKDLLGCWKFEEGGGDVAGDASGCGHDGEITGAQWVRGEFGTALRFTGQGEQIVLPPLRPLDGSNAMTIEAWVTWEGSGQYPNILTGGTWSPGGFMIFVSNDACSFRMGRPGISASQSPDQWQEIGVPLISAPKRSRWYHLAVSFERPLITTYLDGQQVASGRWDYPVAQQGDIVIGTWNGTASHQGLIDEVKIFGRALSGAEIAEQYRSQLAGRGNSGGGRVSYETIPRQSRLAPAVATYETEDAQLAISAQGRCVALIDKQTGEDLLRQSTPLVTVSAGGQTHQRAACRLVDDKLEFHFASADATVTLRVEPRPHYFVVRLEAVDKPSVEQVTFVQLRLHTCQWVNDTSGLAADEQFAVCLRTLDLATLPSVSGNPPTLTASVSREHDFGHGRAALVACPTPKLLQTLQELVHDERVPYSRSGGPFSLESSAIRGSYVFATVSEHDVDQWIQLAQRAGLDTIHLSGWERSLGHYEPRQDLYPHGLDGLKQVVDRFHSAGLQVGIHTLTGCIDTGDRWVSPIPDLRLATDGTFHLASALQAGDTDVRTVEAPGDFPTIWAYSSRGNCIRIDDELILYSAICNDTPCGFFTCQRGAFGTQATAHAQGAEVRHMYTRYGCFVPDENSSLVPDVAQRIADVYNTCGLDQIYMDGAEAMRSWYGIARMRQAIFTRLARPVLVEASCWDHHSWPFHSRVGAWDHPKWGLKRFADDHLRSVEQYRREYLLEGQLGWWVILGPDRDWNLEMPDEIEYLCVKGLAHDVPLSFQDVTATGTPSNARQDEYLTMIGQCERLRMAHYFTDAIKTQLQAEREEFRLRQAADGEWEFLPTDYLEHKVTRQEGTNSWSITNRYSAQPLRLRLEALYATAPDAAATGLVLTNPASPDDFHPPTSAPHVRLSVAPHAGPVHEGQRPESPAASLQLTAANSSDSPRGAWARVAKQFDPAVDLSSFDALGVWVHGDGSGALLNVQLTNLPEYFLTLDDHHIHLDFTGWRYFELFLRERDAAGYHDYQWPYGAHCVLHRSPLVRQAVSGLTLYLNNIPPQGSTTCFVGPITALATRSATVDHPTITVAGQTLTFPVQLTSGMFLEFESLDDCRLYDERGEFVQRVPCEGTVPELSAGRNALQCLWHESPASPARAEITVITIGQPIRGRNPETVIDWSLLRREDELPRVVTKIDGLENHWSFPVRPLTQPATLAVQLDVEQIGSEMEAYDSPSAVTLESCDTFAASSSPDTGPVTAFALDQAATATGCSPDVIQSLTSDTTTRRLGNASICYRASSRRQDANGWSFKGRPLTEPLDLTTFAAIGFWLHGDGGGQLFKLQLLDAEGGWQDMYTRVDFTGWRYCQFPLGSKTLKDLSRITALNLYYNALPAGKDVQCHIDDVRVLRVVEPLRDPVLEVAGQTIHFPVSLHSGDRLVLDESSRCTLYRRDGDRELVELPERPVQLPPGLQQASFRLLTVDPRPMRIVVGITKIYP